MEIWNVWNVKGSKIFKALFLSITFFKWSPPTDNLSDILFDIYSDILSDSLSGILPGILSGSLPSIVSDICFDRLSFCPALRQSVRVRGRESRACHSWPVGKQCTSICRHWRMQKMSHSGFASDSTSMWVLQWDYAQRPQFFTNSLSQLCQQILSTRVLRLRVKAFLGLSVLKRSSEFSFRPLRSSGNFYIIDISCLG